MQQGRILLTGATGYVGGRFRRLLEADGVALRCLTRRPEILRSKIKPTTEVVSGDVLDRQSVRAAMQGIDTAYYMVHSMESSGSFEASDRKAAEIFAEAARDAGVRRIVYLGGLGAGENLSPHLRSRQEVGEILRASGVLTIEFRASIIIGSGSLSFEMIRSLVNRLPIMVTPTWVGVKAQPISIEDVLEYLRQALDVPLQQSEVFEIGGADQVSYLEIMQEYARQRKLRRIMLRVPFLTLRLSSLWLGLVTPVYAKTGRILIESVRNRTVVNDPKALKVFSLRPMGIAELVRRALINEESDFAETRWSDALSSRGFKREWGGATFGNRLVDSRAAHVPVSAAQAFAPIRRIGGETGWYWGSKLWTLRGFLDLVVGGVGVRRGRRHPEEIHVGDVVDFWRVEAYEPDSLLRLSAEMRLPGRAWLQFEVEEDSFGAVIRQTAIFDPLGLPGLLYWYALFPVHEVVFSRMLRAICRVAVRDHSEAIRVEAT